ncbi:hypothetical protein [Actinokineospora bangkokensis]|uniref:Uncharacterized protein n=1 Tax=Actinokineospora bangkokensis TaxID=1193682 RepID=A0A1Q9LCA3_9PSEU|nr:hypothetical protein [Actinokineospora bangkokensis]OLR89661.1 hypothetical protein BJP25_04705 [Actinokineospora bangkokensis]
MDEKTLTEEFTAALAAEPPLGFDPGAVADRGRAATRRRALLASTGGVVVVAAAAAAVAVLPREQVPAVRVAPAAPTVAAASTPPTAGAVVTGPVSWPAPGTPGTTLDTSGAAQLRAAASQYLQTRVRAVVGGVAGVQTRPDEGFAGPFSELPTSSVPVPPRQMGFSVGARIDTAPTNSYLGLAVKAYESPVPSTRLDEKCAQHHTDPSRGGRVECTLSTLSDGGYLLVAEVTYAHKEALPAPGRYQQSTIATYYRPDGVEVAAESSTLPDAPATSVRLSADDLVELVLDPHWSL